ncbi:MULTISPECIES: hypothetical protein [unclassified Sphingomonas]|uniref:hypothetical protein n=1 Tax=unclassified Sphingomonas TaxID=196159 RepID=UPI0006F92F51|nr:MULTISPECIES: hypothetical protein [unclassified Sphingomonas]KQX18143.1 hypothetical protein ASD17_20950 [Sphingomonas sp. Root1294]KQY72698.1 hypothetical protein ASD39_18065 [Sphingomonas sp. Root50]KRB87676.1 hypothetical protein ASE22_23510 [Sphingomonas sp. Root720]
MIFGEYKPDQPPHLQDGLLSADGVCPIANGYAPIPQFSEAANGALGATCLGAAAYRTNSENFVFAATAAKIRRYTSSGYTDVKTGMTSSAAVGVRFCPYASFMLATNGTDPIQKFDPASPSSFGDLDSSAPTARFMAVVRGFVVAGYADDDPLRVAWSDNGDPSEWTPGTLEAGLYQMPSGGDITGVVGGEYGLIFQENRILRMTYTADDTIWQFDEIATDVGCIAPWSLATYGKITFFLSAKGLMACDGITVEAIGSEKVDREFLAMLDRTYLENMSAVVDPTRSLYIVAVPSANPTSLVFLYHYGLQRWTTAKIGQQRMFSALAAGATLEDLDAIYGNLDLIPVSLDSAAFRGGYPVMLMVDGTGMLGGLSGTPMAATLVDARKELVPGRRARINSVRPLGDMENATVTLSLSDSLSDDVASTDYTDRTNGGFYRMRQSANLSQVKLAIAAGEAWSYVQGYDIEAMPGGRA